MPLSEEDLLFKMVIDPDSSKVEAALKGIGEKVAKEGKEVLSAMMAGMSAAGAAAKPGSQMIAGMSSSGKEAAAANKTINDTMTLIAKNMKDILIEESKLPMVLDAEVERHKAINLEIEKTRKLLREAEDLLDPKNMEKRVSLQKQLVEEQKKLKDAQAEIAKEEAKASGGFHAGNIADMYKQGGLKGVAKGLFTEQSGFSLKGLLGQVMGGGGGLNIKQLLGSVLGGGAGGGMGGAVGAGAGGMAAALGPIGLLVAALPELAKAAGKVAAIPFKAIASGFGMVSSGLQALQGDLGPVGLAFGAVKGGIDAFAGAVKSIPLVGDVLGPMAEAAGAAVGALQQVVSSLVAMAGTAGPGQFKMWQVALLDVQATIGESFLPVLDMMRNGVKLFGDVLATILPNQREAYEALAPLKDALGGLGSALRGALAELGPEIRLVLILQLKGLAIILASVARQVTFLTRGFMLMIRPLVDTARALGLITSETGIRSDTGKAAMPAHIGGLDEYKKQLQTAAYTIPGEKGAASPIQQVADNTRNIWDWLQKIDPRNIMGNVQRDLQQPNTPETRRHIQEDTDPWGVRRAILGF